MASKESFNLNQGIRLLLVIAGVAFVVLAMKQMATIINSIALALVLAISASPMLRWLVRKGFSRGLALFIVIVFVVTIILVLDIVVFISLQNVADSLPTYQDKLNTLIDDSSVYLEKIGINTAEIKQLDTFSASNLVDVGVSTAGAILNAMSSWFFMLLLAVYMMIETLDFPAKIEKTLKAGSAMPKQIRKVGADIRSYVSMTVWIGALTSILMTGLLLILGVDFAVLWGILAFVMSFVPYVGFIIALIPPTAFSLLEGGFVEALIVVAGFIILNTMTDNILKPKIMGKGLELSPVVIMLALFIWAWVLGPVGAILAVPLTIIVKELFLETSEDTRWIANLMMPPESILSTNKNKSN